MASAVAKRIGVGGAIILGAVMFGPVMLPFPFVSGPFAFFAISGMFFVSLIGNLYYNINQVSFRQAIVPVRLEGRLNATTRTLAWGTLPLGAIAGAGLGGGIGGG